MVADVVLIVIADDLARSVDAYGNGAGGARRGIVEGSVGTIAIEEAVVGRVDVIPDDLAIVVDAVSPGDIGGQRILECGVGVHWHAATPA